MAKKAKYRFVQQKIN